MMHSIKLEKNENANNKKNESETNIGEERPNDKQMVS